MTNNQPQETTGPCPSPSQLKAMYYDVSPDGHYFDRETMRFFGDTMANYGTRYVKVEQHGQLRTVIELYRKRPVAHGIQASGFFSLDGDNLPGVTKQ